MTEHKDAGELLKLADLIRSHIGELAPACSLPIERWNEIAFDLYDVADRLARPQAAEPVGWLRTIDREGEEVTELCDRTERGAFPVYQSAPSSSPMQEPVADVPPLNRETIQTLLDLLNPLHGELDRQTYDDNRKENFDTPPDYEHNVNITSKMERDLTQAVLILENRKCDPQIASPSPVASAERIDRMAWAIMMDDHCGLTIAGQRVMCDDPRVLEKPDRCFCRKSAEAAADALSRVEAGAVDDPLADLVSRFAHALLKKLRVAFVRIDAINDNPARFDSEINDLCAPFLVTDEIRKDEQ